jgi:ribosomal-protein-alanine N-acetyltransferase
MIKVIIRNAKMSDLKQMKELNEKCLQENYEFDLWHYIWTNNKSHCFVAQSMGSVIGYILCDSGSVISLAIDQQFRNYKIGTELLKHALNSFTNDIKLNVRVTNENAQKLYKNLNFEPFEITSNYYENPVEDAINMIHKYDLNEKFELVSKLKVKL